MAGGVASLHGRLCQVEVLNARVRVGLQEYDLTQRDGYLVVTPVSYAAEPMATSGSRNPVDLLSGALEVIDAMRAQHPLVA